MVASAGNHGVDENGKLGFAGITSPGNAPSAITVGASDHKDTVTRRDDRVAAYSSSGPTWYDGLVKPDVVAPGHKLSSEAAPNSALFKTYPTLRNEGQFGQGVPDAVGHQHVGRRRQRCGRRARSRRPAGR